MIFQNWKHSDNNQAAGMNADVEEMFKNCTDIFNRVVGYISNVDFDFKLNAKVKLIFINQRSVVCVLLNRINDELDLPELQGTTTKVENFWWETPLVVMHKPDATYAFV